MAGIRIGKDGSITRDGKTYKNKAAYKNRDKSKEGAKSSFFDKFIKGERFKRKDREKKYTDSKASVLNKKPAMLGDKGSPIPANLGDRGFKLKFKDAFNAAEKADRSKFSYKGKSYFTTKGAASNRDNKKTRIAPKGTFPKKSNLDADTVASFKKRIKYMKDRKSKGKNFSAKNLKELEAKLAAN